MQKLINFMCIVMILVCALFIGAQVAINQNVRNKLSGCSDALNNHAHSIVALDQKFRKLDGICCTNFTLISDCFRQVNSNHLGLTAFVTNNADVVSLTIQNQQKLIGQIVETAKSDRATVKVMSGLFCERVKDHATLFEMVGRLSMAVGSLTNVLKFAQAPKVEWSSGSFGQGE